jgi:hypothetical protein
MLSRKFVAWVGVGVLSVATIPTFAAPHLARLVARKPAPAATATPHKPTAAKPGTPAAAASKKSTASKPAAVKSAAAAHKAAPVARKTTAIPAKSAVVKASAKIAPKTKTVTKTVAAPARAPGRLQAIEQTNGGAGKTAVPHKSAQKPSASSTAKKLLH